MEETPSAKPYRDHEGLTGCGCGVMVGGCAIPVAFGLVAIFVLNDPGGPLFWPLFASAGAVAGAFIGTAIGFIVHWVREKR